MVALPNGSPDILLAVIERVLADPNSFNPDFEKVDLGDWASVRVYLPAPDTQSSITSPYMEAFIELQTQVYQLAALAKIGVANAGLLAESDRDDLEISVVVSGTSSNYVASLAKPLEALLKRMIGKMTGKQAVLVLLGIAALIAGPVAFNAWLENKRLVQIEELKSKDHVTALQALQYSNEENNKTFRRVLEVLEAQGDAGKRAIDVVQATNEALLRAAEHNAKTVINDVEITRQEAQVLSVRPGTY